MTRPFRLALPSKGRLHAPALELARAAGVEIDVNGRAHPDIAWSYKAPFAESQKIAGLIAFYNEKVDLVVDGLRLERPQTKFS